MPEPENPIPARRKGRPPGSKTVSEYNKRSTKMPIDGPYRRLAEEVRRILGWTEELNSGISTRIAGIKSGVNHNSVAHVVKGIRMEREVLERFGKALAKAYPERKVNVEYLLTLAGYMPDAWQDSVADAFAHGGSGTNKELCCFSDNVISNTVIRMHVNVGETQHEPHFFAYHGIDVAVYTIDPAKQIAGSLPLRQQHLVEEWAGRRKKELLHNWQLLQKGEPQEPIAPLS